MSVRAGWAAGSDGIYYNQAMVEHVTKDWILDITVNDVLLGEGMDPHSSRARRPALVQAAQRALELGPALIHPTALIRDVSVREQRHEHILLDGGTLSGPLVARHLAGAQHVAAVICTIGPELEAEVNRMFGDDPVLGLALDGFGNAATELLEQQICGQIGKRAQAEGLTASTPLSPGVPEWPVEIGQPQIFALVDAASAGIQITPGGMMIPKKSVSFVVGIGPEMTRTDPCEICSLKEMCRYRHA
jgi:hypothetical protein